MVLWLAVMTGLRGGLRGGLVVVQALCCTVQQA